MSNEKRDWIETLEELKGREEKATDGPWELQTSCSFRRIGSLGFDGNVFHAFNNRHDNHPDIAGKDRDFELVIALRNFAIPALEAAREERDKKARRIEVLERVLADILTGVSVHNSRLSPGMPATPIEGPVIDAARAALGAEGGNL